MANYTQNGQNLTAFLYKATHSDWPDLDPDHFKFDLCTHAEALLDICQHFG